TILSPCCGFMGPGRVFSDIVYYNNILYASIEGYVASVSLGGSFTVVASPPSTVTSIAINPLSGVLLFALDTTAYYTMTTTPDYTTTPYISSSGDGAAQTMAYDKTVNVGYAI